MKQLVSICLYVCEGSMSEHVQSTMTFPKDYCCSFKIDLKIGEGEQTRSKEDVHNMVPIMRSNLPNRVLATATIHQLDGSRWHNKDGQLSVHDLITYFRHYKTIHYHHLLLLPHMAQRLCCIGSFSFVFVYCPVPSLSSPFKRVRASGDA